MTYYGANRKTYILDDIPIKKGGEGAIHTVSGKSNLLAKIYLAPAKSPELKEKISLMVKNPPRQDILDQIAWPIDILSDAGGNFVGFVMPKLSIDVELGDVYKYPAKKKVTLTGEQKVIIAINICRVISAIHDLDYVFGDFNPCNIGVNLTNGHVAFLDTDSYHITDKSRGKTYRCNVCLNGYVAPELIKKCKNTGYAQAPLPTFTKETDLFSLAIHIFKLLMNGFTPYNGIPEGERSSTASPGVGNAAIEMDHYCFKAGNRPLSVAVLPLQSFPSDIQTLFTRAFDEGHKNPSKRPSAKEWDAALTKYHSYLKQCNANPKHHYYCELSSCPYCEADQRYNFTMSMNSVYGTSSGSPSSSQMSFSQPMTPPPASSSQSNMSSAYSGSGQYSGGVFSGGNSSANVSQRNTNGFSKKMKKGIIGAIIAAILFSLLFAFVIWPNAIYPNLTTDDLYTPEIVQSYSGTYWANVDNGKILKPSYDTVITFTSCDSNGGLSGFIEYVKNSEWGKFNISAQITKKKNSGQSEIVITPIQWINQPQDAILWTEFSVVISKDFQDLNGIDHSVDMTNKPNDRWIEIKTATDLQTLKNSNGVFVVKNDIDLSQTNWKPIDNFSGTLIGNGYTIKNLSINQRTGSEGEAIGFFSSLSKSAIVSNLIFENVDIKVSGSEKCYVGTIAGRSNGKINYCTVKSGLISGKNSYVGAICGALGTDEETGATVYSCNNYASVIGEGLNGYGSTGGLVGALELATVKDSENYGTITGFENVGGVIGYGHYRNSVLTNTLNHGTVTGQLHIGGICGFLGGRVQLVACENSGLVGSKDAKRVGGIVGSMEIAGDYEMSGLTNTGTVVGYWDVGGIIGYLSDYVYSNDNVDFSLTLVNLSNSGSITAEESSCGGIIGYLYARSIYNMYNLATQERRATIVMMHLENSGHIQGNNCIGGIVGNGWSSGNSGSYISNATNSGTINGNDNISDIIGKAENIKIQ